MLTMELLRKRAGWELCFVSARPQNFLSQHDSSKLEGVQQGK